MTTSCLHGQCPRAALCVALLTIAGVLSAATAAAGGTYTVSACRAGWAPEVRRTALATSPAAEDHCDAGGSLKATFYTAGFQRVNPGDYAAWRFDAPPDTVITGATVDWQALNEYAMNDWGAGVARLEMSTTTNGIVHAGPFHSSDTISGPGATWARVSLVCSDLGASCRTLFPETYLYPYVFVHRSTISILDRLSPVVQAASGPAASDAAWTGAEPLSFSASDRGGGVYRVLVDFDGQVVKTLRAVDDDRCVDRTGARDFADPVPCPMQASGTVTVNAADLPSGDHTVTVYLEDAAGNRAILIPATQKLVVNDYRAVGYYAGGRFFNPRFRVPRVVNGEGAVSDAKVEASFVRVSGKGRSRHRSLTTKREIRFSQRPTVRGTLTAPSGEPIAHATVFVGQQPEGQQWRLDGAVRTDSNGRFTCRLAARQPNRDLRVVYFPFSDSHEYIASAPLTLRVQAGLTLRVSRRSLRNGQRLAFTGRVLGPVPTAGVAVTLQAKVGRRYRSFRQLRASSRTGGRLRTVYRFQRTTSPVRYRFRLKLVRQAGLPYQGGASPTVDVLVRP
jgi:hypothetical protein